MFQCPACDTTLDQDFGMVTCQNCGAVLIVEMSGDVHMGTNDETDLLEKSSGLIDKTSHHEPNFQEDFSESQSIEEKETFDDSEDLKTTRIQVENFTQESNPEEQEVSSSEETMVLTPEESEEFTEIQEQDFPQTLEPEELGNSESIDSEELHDPSQPNLDPVDITEFANSGQSNMDEGEYLYDLTIDRLDSKDLKEVFREVLTDKKLKINDHEFLKKIKNGRVCIPNLNPVKAKRIVEQLQFYDLNIHWKQKRVVMEESLSEEQEVSDGPVDDKSKS